MTARARDINVGDPVGVFEAPSTLELATLEMEQQGTRVIKGAGTSSATAVGRVFIYVRPNHSVENLAGAAFDSGVELGKLNTAVDKVIKEIIQEAGTLTDDGLRNIFVAHESMARDIERRSADRIERSGESALTAVTAVTDWFLGEFAGNRYAADLQDIRLRLLDKLLGAKFDLPFETAPEGSILASKDLYPSEAREIAQSKKFVGVCLEQGGVNDHAASILGTMPRIVGLGGLTRVLAPGDTLAMNGTSGEVFINPSSVVISSLVSSREQRLAMMSKPIDPAGVRTLDGTNVSLVVNAEGDSGIQDGIARGAQGVGLYRTEFLFMDKPEPPSEAEQEAVYASAIRAANGNPIDIRLLDIGDDKRVPWFQVEDSNWGPLGVRGYRAYTANEMMAEVVKGQIRAILRVAIHGEVRILFPMINDPEEFLKARAMVDGQKEVLKRRAEPYNANIKIGAMIETPVAGTGFEKFSRKQVQMDFASIGTNDYTQLELGASRTASLIGHCYVEEHPEILRGLQNVARVAREKGKELKVCGKMASNPLLVPVLLGVGIRTFSVVPDNLEVVNAIISECDLTECEELAEIMIESLGANEAREHLSRFHSVMCDRLGI